MIFVTCGSSELPFNRMMDALSALPADELCIQHGAGRCPPCAEGHRFLPFDEIVARMTQADAVICHAGVGSIICAIRAGHVPVVFPRLKRYREIVDDHQAELAKALELRNTVVVAWNTDELAAAVASARRGAAEKPNGSALALAVRAAVRGQLGVPGSDELHDDERVSAAASAPSWGAKMASAEDPRVSR